MGLRFRKSLRVGNFFKINISKSGIGYSYGIKGAKITKTSKGGVRSTLSIPGTGVSYVHDSKSHKNRPTKHQKIETSDNQGHTVQCGEIKENFNSCELQHIAKKIKRAFILPRIFAISAIVAVVLVYFTPVFFLLTMIFAVLAVILLSAYKVQLEYEVEDSLDNETMKLQNTIKKFCKGFGIWTIESYETSHKKQKGLYVSIARTKATLYEKSVAPIKTNAECLTIKAKRKTYIFLPDMLIVFSGIKVAVISYSDIELKLGKKEVEEPLPATNGAKVVGTTWQKVTKSGKMDKRYSDNTQLAICEYGLLYLYTEKGFQLYLLSTNSDCNQ